MHPINTDTPATYNQWETQKKVKKGFNIYLQTTLLLLRFEFLELFSQFRLKFGKSSVLAMVALFDWTTLSFLAKFMVKTVAKTTWALSSKGAFFFFFFFVDVMMNSYYYKFYSLCLWFGCYIWFVDFVGLIFLISCWAVCFGFFVMQSFGDDVIFV